MVAEVCSIYAPDTNQKQEAKQEGMGDAKPKPEAAGQPAAHAIVNSTGSQLQRLFAAGRWTLPRLRHERCANRVHEILRL